MLLSDLKNPLHMKPLYELKIKLKFDKVIKWPVLLAWATSEPFQGFWAYFECHWFKKMNANLHQFTLTKGGCTKTQK